MPHEARIIDMLIYNTTYAVQEEELACFMVWIREKYIPLVHDEGTLREGRLARILSHGSDEGYSFSLQFCVEDSAALHKWFVKQGRPLQEEMRKVFGNRVAGFSTLMEVIE